MLASHSTPTRVRPINPVAHQARVNLLQAAQPAWGKGRDLTTGEIVTLVPSQTEPNKFHRVTSAGCDCRGFTYRRMCSHFAAAQGVA